MGTRHSFRASQIKKMFVPIQSYMTKYNRTFLLSVKVVTLILISERGSAISSTKQGKSGSIYNLVKN